VNSAYHFQRGGNAGEVASQMTSTWLFNDYYQIPKETFTQLVIKISNKLYNLSLKYKQYTGGQGVYKQLVKKQGVGLTVNWRDEGIN